MRRITSTPFWRSASRRRRPPSAAVTAVVAAAGSGERLGAGGPKAFAPLAGRPMVEWSIAALRACGAVRSIVVAVPPGRGGELAGDGVAVVTGGATRSDSVARALEAVDTELVAIHDAARPLLTPALVEEVIDALLADPDAAGAIAAVPVVDTVKRARVPPARVPPGRVVAATVDRGELWAAQTPQAFRVEALRQALDAYPDDAPTATDESMVVEAAGGRVLIQPGPRENLKVTTPHDLRVAELLLAERER